jgi:hypothetical protein
VLGLRRQARGQSTVLRPVSGTRGRPLGCRAVPRGDLRPCTKSVMVFALRSLYRPSPAASSSFKTDAERGEVQGHSMVLRGRSFHCSVVFFVLQTDSL